MLPLALASQSREAIEAMGYTVQWQTYPMPHSVCAEEIVLMRQWLLERLPI